MTKIKKILYIASIVVAFIIFLSGVSKVHISPFTKSIPISSDNIFAFSDKGSALVSDHRQKLLLINTNNELKKIIDIENSGCDFDKIDKIKIDNGTIYIIGSKHYNKGTYLSSECIATFDLDGNFLKKIYEKKYEEENYITSNNIKNITLDNGKIFAIVYDNNTINVMDISSENQQNIISYPTDMNITDAYYNAHNNELFIFTRIQKIYSITSKSIIKEITYENFTNIRKDFEGTSVKIDNIPVSLSYQTENFLYYLSQIYLVIILLILLIKSLLKNKLNKKAIFTLLIAGLVIFTCVFYSIYSYHITKLSYENLIKGESNIITTNIGNYLRENEKELKSKSIKEFCTNETHVEELNLLQDGIAFICNALGDNVSTYSKVFIVDSNNNVFSLLESRGANYYGVNLNFTRDEYFKNNTINFDTVEKIDTPYSTNYIINRKIYDSTNNMIGIVVVGFYADNLIQSQSDLCLEMAINLSAILIVLYMCFSQALSFYDDFKRRNSRPKENSNDRSADIAGLFVFLQSLARSVDSVILVFASQYLCRNMDPVIAVAMAAIPFSAVNAGQWIGTFFATPITKILGERKSGFLASLISFLTFVLIIISLNINSFILFVIGKFLFGIFINGMLYVLGDTIPFDASNEEIKLSSVASTKEASTSASILSVLISGYISQYLSYSATYLIGAVVTFILFLLIPIFFSKNKKVITEDNGTKQNMGWSMWLTPTMIITTLFFLLPRTILDGYKSYIFPLYTATAGISTLLISNLSVYAKTVGYLFNNNIKNFAKQHQKTTVLSFSQLGIAIAYILFILNSNVYWAIAVLFIQTVLSKMTQTCMTPYISDIAKEKGYDDKQEVSNYYSVNSATYIVQPNIISGFLTLGTNVACFAIGVVCAACLSIFSLFNIKSKK